MLVLEMVFYIVYIAYCGPRFWDFTGFAVFEILYRFLEWFLRGVCQVTISRLLTYVLFGFQT